jgi:hypothetical protein
VVIGKGGSEVDKLRDELGRLTTSEVAINVEEVKRPEIDAQLIADSIAHQLVQRVSFRRAMKRSVQNAMRAGAEGIKVQVAGRLNGAEIARTEGTRRVGFRCTRCGPTSITRSRPPAPPSARSASRCGCSRVRSSRTAAVVRTRATPRRIANHAGSEESQVQEADEGPHARRARTRGNYVAFGEYGLQALEPRLDLQPLHRGGPYRDDPPHQAWRQGLDPDLPGQADHQEAARGPDG